MKDSTKVKSIIGTKFLFDEDIISYKDLVKLMEKTELFDTRFIQKPIKDESEVHSLYIKPEFEVAYLGKSPSADEYYKTAGYSCISYRETTLTDFLEDLDLLDYISGSKENEISQEELVENKKLSKSKKQKKSKFLCIPYEGDLLLYRKKNIKSVLYKNSEKILVIKTYIEDNDLNLENSTFADYEYIANQLIDFI